MFNFLNRKPKQPQEPKEYLGFYDCMQYHHFESNLIYAKDILVEKNNQVIVYTRIFNGTIFVFTLVEDETGFDYSKYNYLALKDKIDELILEPHKSVINLIIFKHKNEQTIKIAKERLENTKQEFNQMFVYDKAGVRLLFYRPVPNFYKLYHHYAEALFFDLAAIDKTEQ